MANNFPISILEFLEVKLPSGVGSAEARDAYVAQWQIYIQPLVSPEISLANVFNEDAYPSLANVLIANLAAYSIMTGEIEKSMLSSIVSSSGATSGPLKKVVTGPSEAEFFNNAELIKQLFGDTGALSKLIIEICTMAKNLGIFLPMCPPLPKLNLQNIKAGRKLKC